MKLADLFEGKVKATIATESDRLEGLKKKLAAGVGGVTQQMVDGCKKILDGLFDEKYKAAEKHLDDVHGAEWRELAFKQYPKTKEDNEWVVRSKFAKDPNSGKRGPWKFDNDGEAGMKQIQLVAWLDGGRSKGYGDKDSDIQKWVAALDAIDKAKSVTEAVSDNERQEVYAVLTNNGPDVDMWSKKFATLVGKAKKAGVLGAGNNSTLYNWLKKEGMFGEKSDKLRGRNYYG